MGQIWHQVSSELSLDFDVFPLYFVLDFTLKMILGLITRRHDRATNKMQYKSFFLQNVQYDCTNGQYGQVR